MRQETRSLVEQHNANQQSWRDAHALTDGERVNLPATARQAKAALDKIEAARLAYALVLRTHGLATDLADDELDALHAGAAEALTYIRRAFDRSSPFRKYATPSDVRRRQKKIV